MLFAVLRSLVVFFEFGKDLIDRLVKNHLPVDSELQPFWRKTAFSGTKELRIIISSCGEVDSAIKSLVRDVDGLVFARFVGVDKDGDVVFKVIDGVTLTVCDEYNSNLAFGVGVIIQDRASIAIPDDLDYFGNFICCRFHNCVFNRVFSRANHRIFRFSVGRLVEHHERDDDYHHR